MSFMTALMSAPLTLPSGSAVGTSSIPAPKCSSAKLHLASNDSALRSVHIWYEPTGDSPAVLVPRLAILLATRIVIPPVSMYCAPPQTCVAETSMEPGCRRTGLDCLFKICAGSAAIIGNLGMPLQYIAGTRHQDVSVQLQNK